MANTQCRDCEDAIPIYEYKCECGLRTDEFRQVAARHLAPTCKCGKRMTRELFPQPTTEHRAGYWTDVVSNSMGVHPSQVAEHRRVYPDIPIRDDGKVIIRSHAEFNRILKRRGYVDRSGTDLKV